MTKPNNPRRTLLLTGASRGIGHATVKRFSAAGWRVITCSRHAFPENCPWEMGPEDHIQVDLADPERTLAAIAEIKQRLDTQELNALVNNAGIVGPTGGVEDIDAAEWRRCIDVGLTGQFLCARRAVPLLKAAAGGSIVNMSSAAGRHCYAFRTPYSAAKFGVIGFTQSLAKELGPTNIRVNAILPGIVEGPRMAGVIRDRAAQLSISEAEMEKRYLERISLRRMVSPRDVAAMVAFLLSDAGRNISGQSIGVDGNVETL